MEADQRKKTKETLLRVAYDLYNMHTAIFNAMQCLKRAEDTFSEIYKGKAYDDANMRKIHFAFSDIKNELNEMDNRVEEPMRNSHAAMIRILEALKEETEKEGEKDD